MYLHYAHTLSPTRDPKSTAPKQLPLLFSTQKSAYISLLQEALLEMAFLFSHSAHTFT